MPFAIRLVERGRQALQLDVPCTCSCHLRLAGHKPEPHNDHTTAMCRVGQSIRLEGHGVHELAHPQPLLGRPDVVLDGQLQDVRDWGP